MHSQQHRKSVFSRMYTLPPPPDKAGIVSTMFIYSLPTSMCLFWNLLKGAHLKTLEENIWLHVDLLFVSYSSDQSGTSVWVSAAFVLLLLYVLVLTCPPCKVTYLRGTCPSLRARSVWYFKTNSAPRETRSRHPTEREGDYGGMGWRITPTPPSLSCPPLFLPSAPSLNLHVMSKKKTGKAFTLKSDSMPCRDKLLLTQLEALLRHASPVRPVLKCLSHYYSSSVNVKEQFLFSVGCPMEDFGRITLESEEGLHPPWVHCVCFGCVCVSFKHS